MDFNKFNLMLESEESFVCPECDENVPVDNDVCPHCNAYLKYQGTCPNCGEDIRGEEEEICPHCGFNPEDEDDDDLDDLNDE